MVDAFSGGGVGNEVPLGEAVLIGAGILETLEAGAGAFDDPGNSNWNKAPNGTLRYAGAAPALHRITAIVGATGPIDVLARFLLTIDEGMGPTDLTSQAEYTVLNAAAGIVAVAAAVNVNPGAMFDVKTDTTACVVYSAHVAARKSVGPYFQAAGGVGFYDGAGYSVLGNVPFMQQLSTLGASLVLDPGTELFVVSGGALQYAGTQPIKALIETRAALLCNPLPASAFNRRTRMVMMKNGGAIGVPQVADYQVSKLNAKAACAVDLAPGDLVDAASLHGDIAQRYTVASMHVSAKRL